MRGLVHEVLAILGWIAAFLIAKTYATDVLPLLPADIPTEALRMLAAFLVLFLGTLLIASLTAIVLSALLNKIGLGWFNAIIRCFLWLGARCADCLYFGIFSRLNANSARPALAECHV